MFKILKVNVLAICKLTKKISCGVHIREARKKKVYHAILKNPSTGGGPLKGFD